MASKKKFTSEDRKNDRSKKYNSTEPTPLFGPQSRKERYPDTHGQTKKPAPKMRRPFKGK